MNIGGSGLNNITDNVIEYNDAESTSLSYGGGIYIKMSYPTLSGNNIQYNTANRGAGIYTYLSDLTILTLTFTGNTITSNSADKNGGGIYLYNSNPLIITGNTIDNNSAGSGYYGGGMYISNSSPTITANDITFNTATDGGGIYLLSGLPTIGGSDNTDMLNFNLICGNNLDQVEPDSYPNNYIFASCTGNTVDIAAIPGVTPPVPGAMPVDAITQTTQYTGTITWDPTDSSFQEGTIYTATITLNVKSLFTFTGVSENFFTVTGATTVTNATDSGVVTAVFPETLAIGESFGGGVIAYILQSGDPDYVEGEQHGLIAATADATSLMCLSNVISVAPGAYGEAIGTGQGNTTTIVNQAGCTSGVACYCDQLTEGGYDDWFLPSKDELNKLWLCKDAIGGFVNDSYWSSSVCNSGFAWALRFDDGYQCPAAIQSALRVRAVRYF